MTLAVNIAQSGSNNQTMRNRIINGAMTFNQRGYNGTPVSGTAQYTLDRYAYFSNVGSKQSVEQSTDAPAGFVNSVKLTTTSAYSSAAGNRFAYYQAVEGYNIADLAWGTANAQPVTLSFWVKSSLTGLFSGDIHQSSGTHSYVFTFNIVSANTWEYKTITIEGPTVGTWATNNATGLVFSLNMGAGSTFLTGTTGTWQAAFFEGATSSVSLVGTLGATFFITGVQLEEGTAASPFENRLYGTELALCQRYYYRILAESTASTFTTGGYSSAATAFVSFVSFPTTMRTAPTALEQSGTASNYLVRQGSTQFGCSSVPVISTLTTSTMATVTATVASGLTAGQSGVLCANSTTAGYLGWSAEL
jgi:hypothetical protein